MTKILPLTGIGGDYLVHNTNAPANIWNELSWTTKDMNFFKQKGLLCSRLGFMFSDAPTAPRYDARQSIYEPEKMNQVLEIFKQRGFTAILLLQNNYTCENWGGTQAWFNDWLAVAQKFKGDKRVSAFSIFGEPDIADTWNSYNTIDPNLTPKQFIEKCMQLARAIHVIDPERIVIIPYMGLVNGQSKDNTLKTIADLKDAGFVTEPNTVYDCTHPYYFETDWDMGLSVAQKLDWYKRNEIQPCIDAFGSYRCFCGETFAWGNKTDSLQIEWLLGCINLFCELALPFNIWSYWSESGYYKSLTRDVIESSNYGHVDFPDDFAVPDKPVGGGEVNFFRGFVVGLRDYLNTVIDSWEQKK